MLWDRMTSSVRMWYRSLTTAFFLIYWLLYKYWSTRLFSNIICYRGCFGLSLVLILCLYPQNVGVENKSALGALLDKGAEKSPSKTRQPRKVDLRARYWAFLFDNLRRAVDEIYVTCESDQSVVECRVSARIRVTGVRNANMNCFICCE